jgi:hypothetical protein
MATSCVSTSSTVALAAFAISPRNWLASCAMACMASALAHKVMKMAMPLLRSTRW